MLSLVRDGERKKQVTVQCSGARHPRDEHSVFFSLITPDSIEWIRICSNKTRFPKQSRRSNWLHVDSAKCVWSFFLTSACSLLLNHNPELLLCLTRGSAFRQLEWFSVLQSKWREEGSTETSVKSYLLIISSHKKRRVKPHRKMTQFTFLMSCASADLSRQQLAERWHGCRRSEFVQRSIK